MKRIIVFLLICFMILPSFVYADACDSEDIKLDAINIVDHSSNIDNSSVVSLEGNKIKLNVNMHEVGDYIKIKFDIKNNSNEKYVLDEKSLVSSSDYVSYSFSIDGDKKEIGANETKTMYLNVTYNSDVQAESFENGSFADNKSLSLNLISLNNKENIVNPKTGVTRLFVIIGVLIIVNICLYYFLNNKQGAFLSVFITGLIVCPMLIKASCSLGISVEANINILLDNYVYTSSNGITNNVDSGVSGEQTTYTSTDSIINNYPSFLRHLMQNGTIKETNVGFVNNGNIYYLKGGNTEGIYEYNKSLLKEVFGEENCTDLNTNYLCENVTGLSAVVSDDGHAEAGDSNWTCSVDGDNSSYCTSW